MSQVLGIGVGSFILVSSWIIALILSIIGYRTNKIIGITSVFIVSLITLILLLIPIESKETVNREEKDFDYYFIWKALLATFLGLCAIGSTTVFITQHCTEPLNAKPIQNWLIEN